MENPMSSTPSQSLKSGETSVVSNQAFSEDSYRNSSRNSSSPLKFYHPEKGQNHNVMIQAGAGAGKTTELVSRVLSFALEFKKNNQVFPKIIVTTFTIKATQELKERLLKASLSLEEELPSSQAEDLRHWLLSSKICITTIHSLVLRFLREKAFEVGIFSDFQVLDEADSLVSEFLKGLFFDKKETKEDFLFLLSLLSFSDLKICFHEGIKELLAFGTLVPYEAKEDQQEWEESLVFNREALKKNLQGVSSSQIKTESQKRSWACYQELIHKNFFSYQDIQEFFSQHSLDGRHKFGRGEEDLEMITLLKKIKDLGDSKWDPSQHQESQRLSTHLVSFCFKVFSYWVEFFKKKQKIPLADIEYWGLYLLRLHPHLGEEFSKQWDYWYIDEYQDTSLLQEEILKALMGEKKGFFVGDPQQSIYLFRGARPHVFAQKYEKIKKEGGEVLHFSKNYRTEPLVLDFINQITAKFSQTFLPMTSGKKKKKIPSGQNIHSGISSHEAHRCDQSFFGKGNSDFVHQGDQDSLHPGNEKILFDGDSGWYQMEKFCWESLEEKNQEKEMIKSWIGKVCADYIENHLLKKKGVRLNEVAIVSPQSRDLMWISQELEARGLAYQLHSGGQFYQRHEVLDSLMVLRFLLEPDDEGNLLGLLRCPWLGFSDKQWFLLGSLRKTKKNIWDLLQEFFSEDLCVQALWSLRQQSFGEGIFWSWLSFLKEKGCFSYYRQEDPSGIGESNLWKLVTELYQDQNQRNFDWHQHYWVLRDKIEQRTREKESLSDAEDKRIQLMTIHASKGLEFTHLLCPFYERRQKGGGGDPFFKEENSHKMILAHKKGFPPQAQRFMEHFKDLEKQERERVFYVGITRAKESLYIPYLVKDRSSKEPSSKGLSSKDSYVKEDLAINGDGEEMFPFIF
jgi:ATP-dependent helicase/nuclease subunit A